MLSFSLLTYAVSFLLCWFGADSSVLLYATAGIIHEFGHIIAARLMRMRVSSPRLKAFRAVIDLISDDRSGVIITALSGPLANILTSMAAVILLGECGKSFSVISLFAAIFNLMPIYPLDGSTMLIALLSADEKIYKGRAIFCDTISSIFLFSLTFVSIYRILKYGDSELIFLMLLRCFFTKRGKRSYMFSFLNSEDF